MKTVVIIPCRMASERLPKKFMQDINGKTLIRRVYENVSRVFGHSDLFIACDGEPLYSHTKEFGANAVITDPDLPSGTDRIAAALKEIDPNGDKYDIVINFQGDDVNVDPTICARLVDLMRQTKCDIATVAQPIDDAGLINNPNIVKIAMGENGRCVYFSRSPIPFARAVGGVDNALWHIGIYVYNAASLRKFVSLPVGKLEATEKLEQLRALENGMSIYALTVKDTRMDPRAPADVNTAEDLEEMRRFVK
ncbi:MAG: 3-deoxy-manno-octulosonate cytidylyltransferase [Proteobacteria bacterium]|nr:3-deoxy-manno-octulosonate cytidylyltransferase [Pseudomonadota bacterium]